MDVFTMKHTFASSENQSYLNNGRVNFIRPCSVAIFKAKGMASSHLAWMQRRNHLKKIYT